MHLMVNPYGTASAAPEPGAEQQNLQVHSIEHVRLANEDDLEGMAREPSTAPDSTDIVGIANTDDLEMKVLQPTLLTVGADALRIEAHATLGTVDAPPELSGRAAQQAAQVAAEAANAAELFEELYARRRARQGAHAGEAALGTENLPGRRQVRGKGGAKGAGARAAAGGGSRGGAAAKVAALAEDASVPGQGQHNHMFYAVPARGSLALSRGQKLVAFDAVENSMGQGRGSANAADRRAA